MPGSQFGVVPGVAYHITSAENWDSVQRDGVLRPSSMALTSHWDVAAQLQDIGIAAVTWLWPFRPEGLELFGLLVDRMTYFSTPRVVMLAVTLQPHEYIGPHYELPNGDTVDFVHHGSIGHDNGAQKWHYHPANAAPFLLAVVPLPLDRVQWVRTYDFARVLEPTGGQWITLPGERRVRAS